MLKEFCAFDLKQLKSLISQITAKKLNEGLIENFNHIYQLNIQILSPQSLYLAAEIIEKRVQKQMSLGFQHKKDQSIKNKHLGQMTILVCTLIYFLNLKKINIQSITQKDLGPLQKIFLTKNISMLYFQAKHIVCKTFLDKNQWSEEAIAIFRKIMDSKYRQFMDNEKAFKWKYISYELFKQIGPQEFHSAKDCRQKWLNHFNPQLVKTTWSWKEDIELFIALNELGCKWSLISKNMGRQRTQHMVKNRANALLKRYLKKKIKKTTNQHITFVLEALKEEQGLQNNIQQEVTPFMFQVKMQESESDYLEIKDQIKLDMEDILAVDRDRQINTLEFQQNLNSKSLMESVKKQQNEKRDFFYCFESNKLNK